MGLGLMTILSPFTSILPTGLFPPYWYDPYTQIEPSGEKRTPRVGLSHELQHSYDADQGTMTREITENGVLLIEVRAINTENKIRMKTGAHQKHTFEESGRADRRGVG